ncbi:hypothetical protein X801_05191 [Opisthorchis viverrini]|uniref:Uncharacterized protein n=1 Tax=Opisthorchis viverrini TaxID=6198 RepID=A0A1S8WWW5_OPIVI|nr:hypothetical protein X801_05191 [Opisthorchis viverrini]
MTVLRNNPPANYSLTPFALAGFSDLHTLDTTPR